MKVITLTEMLLAVKVPEQLPYDRFEIQALYTAGDNRKLFAVHQESELITSYYPVAILPFPCQIVGTAEECLKSFLAAIEAIEEKFDDNGSRLYRDYSYTTRERWVHGINWDATKSFRTLIDLHPEIAANPSQYLILKRTDR